MQATKTYQAFLTVNFELGGFAVGVVTCFGVPVFYLTSHVSCETDTADKALSDAAFTVWEKQDMGASETFAVKFRGRVRLMTSKEWRTLNTALSAPLAWAVVQIDEVISIGKPVGWQVFVSNIIQVALWLMGMAIFFRVIDWCVNSAIRLIYG